MRKKLLLAQIAELENKLKDRDVSISELSDKILSLSSENGSLNAIIGEYRAREQSIMTAMTEAGNNASRILDDAKKNASEMNEAAMADAERLKAEALSDAERIRSEAQADAKAIMDDAHMEKTKAEAEATDVKSKADAEAIRVISEAEAHAKEIRLAAACEADKTVSEAKEQSSKMLFATESTAAEYEQTLAAYNAQLEQLAADLTANAQHLAAFARNSKITDTSIAEETKGMYRIPYSDNIELPDAGDDPAAVMRNIYALQHRELPDNEDTVSVLETDTDLTVTADEPADQNAAGNDSVKDENCDIPQDNLSLPENDINDNVRKSGSEGEDGEEAPLVSLADLTPGDGGEIQNDNATLDELLDEIIRSGELNYGKEQE